MSRRGIALALSTALLAGLAAGAFFTCFERRAVERRVPGSEESRRNPFLAAERLFGAMGFEVRSLPGPLALDPLPPPEATLIFTPNRRTLSEERHAALREWVERGGHLVVETWQLWDDERRRGDPLLDPLGFQAHEAAPAEVSEELPEELAEQSVQEIFETVLRGWLEPDPSMLDFPEAPEPLLVVFDARFHWRYTGEQPVRLAARGESGEHLITIPLGRGLLTALTDGHFLQNDTLGEEDHAESLLRLARLGGREGPVWIVTGEEWPSLFEALWRHGRPALAGAGLWLAAFVWRAARRRGPARPTPLRERRSWLEHLDAVGRYHWRRDRGRSLREASRQSLLRELERAHPGWSRLPPEARNAMLAATAELRPDEVARALAPARGDRESRFVDAIRTMERFRTQ